MSKRPAAFMAQDELACINLVPAVPSTVEPVSAKGTDASNVDVVFSGSPFAMTDLSSLHLGSYMDVVGDLRLKLKEALTAAELPSGKKFGVVVFGHGGRDTICCLALVEAVACDEALRESVRITHCSCSWTHDAWEPIMASYLTRLVACDKIPADLVDFQVMKYHEEVGLHLDRVKGHLDGKHCVVQCEQGVDMFVEPITSEWLQDNYEDFAVHNACLAHAEHANIPALLIQTNADLDLPRGIDGDDVSANVFGGGLQMSGAFSIGVTWSKLVSGKPPAAADLISIALVMNVAEDKKTCFEEMLNFDVSNFESLSGFYAAYIAYSAYTTNSMIPVAGILEVMYCLIQQGHTLPFTLHREPPAPQWCAARFLKPAEVDGRCLRVVSQFRGAEMDSAPSFAVFFSRWMVSRSSKRLRRNLVSGRCNKAFWLQLEAAKRVAEEVRRECPDFNLWPDSKSEFFQCALERMAKTVKAEDVEYRIEQDTAKKGQEDFGELSPLWKFTRVNFKMFLDFTCRLLESPVGIAEEYVKISSGLDPLEVRPPEILYSRLFKEALIAEWLARHCKS